MADAILIDDEFKKPGRLDLSLWRRLVGHLGPYRRPLAGLGASGAVLATIDIGLPLVTGWLIDAATTDASSSHLLRLGALYLAMIVLFSACVWYFIILAGRTSSGVARDLRRKAFNRLQDLPFSYFDVRPTGWLVSRLTSDCQKVSSIVPWFMLDLVWGTCMIVGLISIMLYLHAQLALVVMVIIPPLVIVTVFFQAHMLESSRLMRRTNSMITATFTEAIMGVRTTRILAREDESLEEFNELANEMRGHALRNTLQSVLYLPIVISLGSVGVGFALWRGGILVGDPDGGLTPGVLVAFMQYAALFYMPIQELATRFTQLQSAQAAAERVQSLLETEPEIRDSADVRKRMAAHAEAAPSSRALDGGDLAVRTLEFRDVSFWYVEGEPVLRDFSLTVSSGQTIALVGATGGGKSTIVSLAARFYEPCAGSIFVNGVDYRERSLEWLQSRLGVVLQTPHLFADTIRENIRYGCLEATDADIAQAARLAGADAFIDELEDGYDFEVGESGARLSTGQRQLITLARAILADPDIFIMDEATSSVDTETERLIQRGIERVLDGRIAFVIAHRLSTIRRADRILVIDQGRVIEDGTHEELMARDGHYAALARRQVTVEDLGTAEPDASR